MEPTIADAGQLLSLRLDAENDVAATNATWTLYLPDAAEQGVTMTEFLANPTGHSEAPHFNPLRRETSGANPTQEDEFVELVNLSPLEVDCSGWTISDALQVRHRFPAPSLLTASNAVVVYGGPREGSLPVLEVATQPASEGNAGLSLNNTGDSLLLRNAADHLIERIVYSGAWLSSQGSLSRHPTADDAFVPQAETASGLWGATPGLRADGRQWNDPAGSVSELIGPVMIRIGTDGHLVLSWSVAAERSYSVLGAWKVDGPWEPWVSGLTDGEYVVPIKTGIGAKYLRIASP
jgi:hypothetical protein